MIRPLRRRHRWIIPTLLLALTGATVLTLTHPVPSARVDALPRAVVEARALFELALSTR